MLFASFAAVGPSTFAEAVSDAAPRPFAETSGDDLRARIASTDDRILILTPAALYRFHPESEAWSITTASDGLPGAPQRSFSLSGGDVWVCGEGACVSDQRFDDWERYEPGQGYPGRVVFDIEADDDYAYAGADGGAARFDRYIFEWEDLAGAHAEPLGPVSDVAVGDEKVWFALEHGVAEYRKDAESIRVDTLLGELEAPRVLALRQSARFVWALSNVGIARYDKELESWMSFRPGVDVPQARVHQFSLIGDDVWLGTDDGLWRYRADAGIWRRDESAADMPGTRVTAFAVEAGRIWVVTDVAFARYDLDAARWIDFTASVPLPPTAVSQMAWEGNTLVFLAPDVIVYGLSAGQDNPSLFTYRTRAIEAVAAEGSAERERWRVALDDAGLGVVRSENTALHVKGGATVFVENAEDGGSLDDLNAETRMDLTVHGRVGPDRTLGGFYDSTDPDNPAYQLTYRGARSDVLRVLSAGEIEEELFNSRLATGTGLRGGRLRAEAGGRTERTRRRLLTLDGWVGERRTLPGRDTFYGGNLSVSGRLRDIDYTRLQVFDLPDGWRAEDLENATIYKDDGESSTDDANSSRRAIAGRDGVWDALVPNADYSLGPRGETLILSVPLEESGALVAVAETRPPSTRESDLTDSWLRNHYWIALEPVPGSIAVTITDSTGSHSDASGIPYTEFFGLDANGDGSLDPDRFSPVNGFLNFPEERPFREEVYSSDPLSRFSLSIAYEATLNTFQLSHQNLVPRSERITVDRALLRSDVDYSIIAASGLFVLFEHVLLDEDSAIEVEYLYEVDETASAGGTADDLVVAGQVGIAPNDFLFGGANLTTWSDEDGRDVMTGSVNARLESKGDDHLLRVSPELAWSGSGDNGGGRASGISFRGRHRALEVSAAHRALGANYSSFEDRRTLLGRLLEETNAHARYDVGRHLQAEFDWEKSRSDSVAWGAPLGAVSDEDTSGTTPGRGEESSYAGSLRYLRSGWPNLELRRGRVVVDAPGRRQTKHISRAEIELSPEQAGVRAFGIRRLWLRAFLQRSERHVEAVDSAGAHSDTLAVGSEKSTTDQAFVRLNGSLGTPLSWNVAFEDRRTFVPERRGSRDVRRRQAVDATLQAQPHTSVDAFLRWQSNRDIFRHPGGDEGGFSVRRLVLATVQAYPGRIWADLSPISFRLDLGGEDTESGEPGVTLPDFGSLWSASDHVSERMRGRNGVLEARIQVLSRLRLIERIEIENERFIRERLASEGETRRVENRVEIRPHGGLVILRVIGSREETGSVEMDERRFSGQWDQTWGRGILTFASLEAQRDETRDRLAGDLREHWAPQAQITWRRSRWKLDAALGAALSWTRTKDSSRGSESVWDVTRRRTVSTSLSIQPHSVITLKLNYSLGRAETATNVAVGSPKRWETEHDLRLRLQIRA